MFYMFVPACLGKMMAFSYLCRNVVQRYEFSRDLNAEVATICETIQPVEVIPAAGAFQNHLA
eukprot:COSAG06_NODE_11289_length_1532_cov_2.570133_2_plen_62_part_00